MQRRPNVRNCPHDIQLHFIGIGGARLDLTNDSHCIFRYMNRLRAVRPNIVYVHIGENYLSNMAPTAILDNVLILVQRIVDTCHPQATILSQLIVFPRNQHLSQKSLHFNRQLQSHFTERPHHGSTYVYVWRKEIGIFGLRGHRFFGDADHLNDVGMARSCRRVGIVVGRTRRFLQRN